MLDRAVLKTFRPLIVTPCFGEKLCLNYVLSIINFQRECMAAGIAFDFFFRPGDSLVIPPGAPHRFENPYDEEAEIDNLTRPRLVHEIGLRLLYAAMARKRPNPLELAVAFHDGDNFPAFLPPRVAMALVTVLYSISKVTGVANRFRQAVLPASLA